MKHMIAAFLFVLWVALAWMAHVQGYPMVCQAILGLPWFAMAGVAGWQVSGYLLGDEEEL